MNLKFLKHWLNGKRLLNNFFDIAVFSLLFLTFANHVFASDFERHKITFEKIGDAYYSPVIYQDKSFNTITLKADYIFEGLMVNLDPLGEGVWRPVDIQDVDIQDDKNSGAEALIMTTPTKSAQFKKNGIDSRPLMLEADFLYSESDHEITKNLYSGPEIAASGIKITNRKEWGADESLRFWTPELEELYISNTKDEEAPTDTCEEFRIKFRNEVELTRVIETAPTGEHLIWPLAYSKSIKKIIVHHTDSELRDLTGDNKLDGLDYKAFVRAIYHFHAVTRGWGDIGYNYIIDPLGNIYEGRYGGEKVIGAHARCYNNGSIGIAIIGDYQDNIVPKPALDSLIILIAQKSKLLNIDPLGESTFRGEILPNIIGHRDVGKTTCPGKNLYSLLSDIKERADILVRSGVFKESILSLESMDYNAESMSQIQTISMKPNETKSITLSFKNTGTKTWDKNTWLHVALNNNPNARVVPLIEDKIFVAGDLQENEVQPDKTGTFKVELEAGYFAGYFSFEVAPVVNGRYKVSRAAVAIPILIEKPNFDYKVVSQDLPSGTVFQGQKILAYMKLQNTGNVKWVNYGTHLIRMGTEDLRDRRSLLSKGHTTRVANLLESEVPPGQQGTFVFDLTVPENYIGRLSEKFSPVIENVTWLENKGLGFEIAVKKPRHAAKIIQKPSITDLMPGEMRKIEIAMQNAGDLPWDSDNMQITLLSSGIKIFKKRIVPEGSIKPKEEANFIFWIQAPYKSGMHKIFLRPKFNLIPIQGGTVRFLINVQNPSLRAQLLDQTSKSVNLTVGQEKEVQVKFKNIGNSVWQKNGENAIYLAPSKPHDRLSKLYYSQNWESKYRTAGMEQNEVKPGETATFKFKVKPQTTGFFQENFQLVIENVGWIDNSFVHWDFKVTKSKSNSPESMTSQNSNASSTISSTEDEEKLFRVKISYKGDFTNITANKNYKIFDKNNAILFSMGSGNKFQVKRLNKNLNVQYGNLVKVADIIRIVPDEGGVIEIVSMERRPSWNASLNDNKFRGILEIRAIDNETVYINELTLEDYLKGLAEVSNDTPTEKQKAIAVLARTYARFYMQSDKRKFPGMPYDGSDDPAIFQRYLGYGVEIRSPNFVKAVDATKDEVVTYNGKLVKTPYFNQSDGRTRSAQEVWGWTDTPYLQSVDDPYCKGLAMLGHGVGMSGCGSEGMAKAGKTYREIIKYYYQGVEIEKLQILNFK